jgi:nucleoredoxin
MFSWCSPCARFTPKLIQTYNNLTQRGEQVEIVLCTLDQMPDCYQSYTTKLPWLAIPFHSSGLSQRLLTKFEIAHHGIPHVAIILPNSSLLDVDDAVHQITLDPQGTQFPWPARPLCDLLPVHVDQYSSSSNRRVLERVPVTAWHTKYLMLYFATHASANCRAFGPKLNQFYTTLKAQRDDFEVRVGTCRLSLSVICWDSNLPTIVFLCSDATSLG